MLQICHKGCITFAGNYGKSVHLMHFFRKCIIVLAHTISVYAQAQATSYFLTFLWNAIRLTQRTYLEHVWIVPTFAECWVGEDETYWFIKAEQSFLVLQDKVIGRDVIALIAATLQCTIYCMPFLVYREISCMGGVGWYAAKIRHIVGVEHVQIVIQLIYILLLEYLTIATQLLVAVFVILAVVRHFIHKEQR